MFASMKNKKRKIKKIKEEEEKINNMSSIEILMDLKMGYAKILI
jgi:hypothetical protein